MSERVNEENRKYGSYIRYLHILYIYIYIHIYIYIYRFRSFFFAFVFFFLLVHLFLFFLSRAKNMVRVRAVYTNGNGFINSVATQNQFALGLCSV